MIEYELYEKDEVIKPRSTTKKPKTKKSDHKHNYKYEVRKSWWGSDRFIKIEVCTICKREGNSKLLREGEENE